jgi:hypothetical protein
VQDKKRQYDSERSTLLSQVKELNRLETNALEGKQVAAYSEVGQLRQDINEFLIQVQEKSDRGTELIQDYYHERVDVVEVFLELDKIAKWAEKNGDKEIADKASLQRAHLAKTLLLFRGDDEVTNTAFLVDFPLAAREAGRQYQNQNWITTYRDLEREKRRLEQTLNSVAQYDAELDEEIPLGVQMDLKILEFDLLNLKDRLSRFQKAMAEVKPEEIDTNLELWNDMAGFHIADILHNSRKSKSAEINAHADQIMAIETELNGRRRVMQDQLELIEGEIQAIQDRLLSRNVQIEQMERQRYLDTEYFDTSERELEEWEESLMQSDEP